MSSERTLAFLGPDSHSTGARIREFCTDRGLSWLELRDFDEVRSLLNRSSPATVVIDSVADPDGTIALCRELKVDAFTGIVPVVILVGADDDGAASRALIEGADEVLHHGAATDELWLRLDLVLRRADRDVAVHPTTRLPGTVMIERDIQERIRQGQAFGVCYADLDHFKEFNDRYGYGSGDRVIFLLSKILRDVVRALAPGGFVGHIGGDDFIYNVPLEYIAPVGDEIIQLFDTLIPYQYTEEDRRAGYFLGKDRRGAVHRIPLMTLSIGVVTNQFLELDHTAQVSELAAEMKSYAKSLPGSKYVVDRRRPFAEERAESGPTSGGDRRED
ncbi:MAG: diguanylate cyclase [Longimicrobiales bacterium]|nr:diguanylate cyclase [Longimicrobiales bacterium]